jgi:hypothetical protein
MIIIGIVRGCAGLASLCWLLFALAVYALPCFAGVAVELAAYQSDAALIGAIIVGAITRALVVAAIAWARITFSAPRDAGRAAPLA